MSPSWNVRGQPGAGLAAGAQKRIERVVFGRYGDAAQGSDNSFLPIIPEPEQVSPLYPEEANMAFRIGCLEPDADGAVAVG